MEHEQKLQPDRIRAIRKKLGLTQMEAGKLVGGGPHAFTRYEAGALKPSTAMINLLLILDENPHALRVLGGSDSHPVSGWMPSPFEVEAGNIALLSPLAFTGLVRRLLLAEAGANDLPQRHIHVASSINVRDGGEDGRISWRGGPEYTQFLPSRLCQFQLKSGGISPVDAGKEVIASTDEVKNLVRLVLEDDGHYIMLCSHPYNQQLIDERQRKICDALEEAGCPVPNDRVIFRGGDQIAEWVNTYPSVALWVREKVGLGTLGGFVTWKHWYGRSEHSVSWVEDPRLSDLGARLRRTVSEPRGVLRVVGLSGIGKSRLCLEALGRLGKDEIAGRTLENFVMYAVQSEVGAEAIYPVVKKLAISGGRAIVIVDDCDPEAHRILFGMASRANSRLSLITIDNEIPEKIDTNTIKINEAQTAVMESIVKNLPVALNSLDQDRLARLSEGFPKVAIRIAREYDMGQHLIDPVDGDLINRFVCGRSSVEKELLLKSAQLLAAFGTVRIESAEKGYPAEKNEPSSEDHLYKIAKLGRQLTREELYVQTQRLVGKGIVKRRGGLGTIEPPPCAIRLAERQWTDWDQKKWELVLTGDIGHDLNVSAARRLAELNTTEIANRVVDYVCRQDGPFDEANGIETPGCAEVLSALAEIKPDIVAECIDRSLNRLDDLRKLGENVHSILVRMLSKIAFHSGTFKVGARLLLRLEDSKQPFWMSDASQLFAKLFSPVLGGTEANGETRLSFLDEMIYECSKTNDIDQLKYIVDALDEGSMMMDKYFRTVGPEIQGSRRALDSWLPTSRQERYEYNMRCAKRIGELAKRDDEVGEKARLCFGRSIPSLIRSGFIEEVEKVIPKVIREGHPWTMALRQLKVILVSKFMRIDDETSSRVKALINELAPTGLRERVRLQVTESPMPELGDEKWSVEKDFKRRRATAQELAGELLQDSLTLKEILPEISRGRQFLADELGNALAECAPSPLKWLEPIVQAIKGVPASNRSYDLLTGFIAGLPEKFHDEVEEFKTRALKSLELAPAVPMICGRAGLTPKDIDRAIDALNRGTLSPWDLHHWTYIGVFKKVEPTKISLLLDTLMKNYGIPAFAFTVTILGQILDDEDNENGKYRTGTRIFKLAGFRPQLLKVVQNAGCWSKTDFKPPTKEQRLAIQPDIVEYHFEKIFSRILAKGSKDSDARKTALELARTLVHGDHHDLFYPAKAGPSSVLSRMLTDFPEIVWPIVGGAILENPRFANQMRYLLGQLYTLKRDFNPPILDVHVDILFAWCYANPDGAPSFMAQCAPFFSKDDDETDSASLHPVMSRLLDEFGDRDDVLKALGSHIHPYHWIDSCVGHYARLGIIFQQLTKTHSNPRVRQWAEKMSRQVGQSFKRETTRDEERKAGRRWIG